MKLTAFSIKHKLTGVRWTTSKNKVVWAKVQHAKSAFLLSEGVRFEDQNVWVIVKLVEEEL